MAEATAGPQAGRVAASGGEGTWGVIDAVDASIQLHQMCGDLQLRHEPLGYWVSLRHAYASALL